MYSLEISIWYNSRHNELQVAFKCIPTYFCICSKPWINLFYFSSGFLRIPQEIWLKSSSWFDDCLVKFKSTGRFRLIFVAFLKNLNIILWVNEWTIDQPSFLFFVGVENIPKCYNCASRCIDSGLDSCIFWLLWSCPRKSMSLSHGK